MPRRRAKIIFSVLAIGACTLGALQWHAQHIFGLPSANHFCDVDILARRTIGEDQFAIVDVSCDAIAKDEMVQVYGVTHARSWYGLANGALMGSL